ncbi:MAG: SHOCT-like domain-containing protein [Anaerolineae bacterium]
MTTSEERMKILKMIADKQITAEEGARLLEALRAADAESQARTEPPRARWLRIRVTERTTGRVKLNVTIPIGLVDVGLKMGARFAPEMAGMDVSAIKAALRDGIRGRIIEVDDEKDDERVEIFME